MGKRKNTGSNDTWHVEDISVKSKEAATTKDVKKMGAVKNPKKTKSTKPAVNLQEEDDKAKITVPEDEVLEYAETGIKRVKSKKTKKADEAIQVLENISKLDTKLKKKSIKPRQVETKESKASRSDCQVKAKKIIFIDDEANNKTVTKQYLDAEEATVKDEDIDKFCDEINEEDNKQYENWVKLIEANFHSNKKKT